MSKLRYISISTLAATVFVCVAATHVSAQTTVRVSVDSAGNQADLDSYYPAISGNGRYVAFHSDADLTPDFTIVDDVFIHDRDTGVTERMSTNSVGVPGNGNSYLPEISSDGRYVTFESAATNLVLDDTNGTPDVFIHDRDTGSTELVSVRSNGDQSDGPSTFSSVSADGRYVAFESAAANLVPGDTNSAHDIFVRDRAMGITERISVSSNGGQATKSSFEPSITPDGRFVVFGSLASDLVLEDTNGRADVFVHDRDTGITERVSVSSGGIQANGDSGAATISANGRYVAFISSANNLAGGASGVFVHDRYTGSTAIVSVDSDGTPGNSSSYDAAITADGRFVAFSSFADNLVEGDTNGDGDTFIHDRSTGTTERISVTSDGAEADSFSWEVAISATGRYVAFESLYLPSGPSSISLVPGDTNAVWDIFVRDRGAPTLDDLIILTNSFSFPKGIDSALLAMLQNVKSALEAENAAQRKDAANKLRAFIDFVEAQRSKRITQGQADLMIVMATDILADMQSSSS